jgi:cytochrome c biogenesis protein CcdA
MLVGHLPSHGSPFAGQRVMNELLTVLTPIALIDSTSMIPMSIVPLAILFAGKRPLLSSAAFIVGIFLPYLIIGILIAVGLGGVIAKINEFVVTKWNHPDTLDLILQIVIGVVLFTIGYRMALTRRKQEDRAPPDDVSPAGAFTFAAGLVLVGIPGALPYFAAIDQLLRADLPVVPSLLALVYYNVVFALPLVVLVLARAIFPKQVERISGPLGRLAEKWGRRLIVTLLIILGLVLVLDGVGWFVGRPLPPVDPLRASGG